MNDLKYTIESGQVVSRKTGKSVPRDEPVFLFRARDAFAVSALEYYRDLCDTAAVDESHVDIIRRDIARFRHWQMEHKATVRKPGRRLEGTGDTERRTTNTITVAKEVTHEAD